MNASTWLGRCLVHCGVNPASSVSFPSGVRRRFSEWLRPRSAGSFHRGGHRHRFCARGRGDWRRQSSWRTSRPRPCGSRTSAACRQGSRSSDRQRPAPGRGSIVSPNYGSRGGILFCARSTSAAFIRKSPLPRCWGRAARRNQQQPCEASRALAEGQGRKPAPSSSSRSKAWSRHPAGTITPWRD
jgi:hypothetical protein